VSSAEEAGLALDQQVCFKLYAASRAIIRGYRPMLDGLGLTYPQYLVMLVLWEWRASDPAQPTVKALGRRLRLDSGTLTPLLKRLERLGLVRRQRATHDEREVHLGLTSAGIALREQVPAVQQRLDCAADADAGELLEVRERLDWLLRLLER
jgi:DNA-binding MarR family transcriptional regulator